MVGQQPGLPHDPGLNGFERIRLRTDMASHFYEPHMFAVFLNFSARKTLDLALVHPFLAWEWGNDVVPLWHQVWTRPSLRLR